MMTMTRRGKIAPLVPDKIILITRNIKVAILVLLPMPDKEQKYIGTKIKKYCPNDRGCPKVDCILKLKAPLEDSIISIRYSLESIPNNIYKGLPAKFTCK